MPKSGHPRLTKELLCGGLAVAAFAACSSPAAAQTAGAPGQQTANGRLFDLTLSARALYDSNVARGTAVAADVRGISNSDTIYTTDAVLNAAHRIGPLSGFLQATVGYESYEKNHALNGGRYGFNGGAIGKLGPCGGSLYDQFSRRQSDLRDLNLAVTRNTETDNAVGLTIDCSPLAGITAGVTGVLATTRNSTPIVPDSNSDQFSVFAGYTNTVLGTLNLTGQYQEISYKNRGPLVALTLPGVTIYGAGVQYQRPIGARLHGSIGVSYIKADSDAGSAGGFSGTSANAALTYQPTSRLQAELNYARNISATLQLGSSYMVNNAANLRVRYTLSPRLAVAAGGAWNHRDYRGAVNPLLFVGVSRDETKSVFGSVTGKLGRKIDLSLDATYEDRKTDLPIFDYHGYRVGLSASAHF